MVSSAFYYSYLESKEDCYQKASTINYPLMVQVAGDDKIIQPDSILKFYEAMKPHGTLKSYPQMYHEIYNEPDRRQAFDHLEDWIQKHQT